MCSTTSSVYTSFMAVISQTEDIMMRYLTPTTKILDILPELVIHISSTKIPGNSYLSSEEGSTCD